MTAATAKAPRTRKPPRAPTAPPAAFVQEQSAWLASLEQALPSAGPSLAPESKLDPDLARLADGGRLEQRVTPPRRRLAYEVPLVYVGTKDGSLAAQQHDLVVPDTENDGVVKRAMKASRDLDGAGIPTGKTVHASGPEYHFKLKEATLVHEEDAWFFLEHPVLEFTQVTTPNRDTEQNRAASVRPQRRRAG